MQRAIWATQGGHVVWGNFSAIRRLIRQKESFKPQIK